MSEQRFFFTGAENRRYFCELIIFHSGNDKVYSFRADFDGEYLNIVKKDSEWVFHSGRSLYLDKWIAELGEQVDSGRLDRISDERMA
jgi:uncharacterized phage-like protein YoqJ